MTDGSEVTEANDDDTVDNVGLDNYLLYEFSEKVTIDSAFLGYVANDSDLTAWIGTKTDPFNNHEGLLSDAYLLSLGFTEVNLTDLTTSRTADLNAGSIAGNVLVTAAWTEETTPEDRFKIQTLTVTGIANGAPLPEPGTLAMFGVGLAGLALVRRRRPSNFIEHCL